MIPPSNEKETLFVIENIKKIFNPATRDDGLSELSKKRETFPELATYLWCTPGLITTLFLSK